jgi:NDP-sugar pyrophosphorylase family protein
MTLLGTAGGIARARSQGLVLGNVLVWNTDIFADFDLEHLVAAHVDAVATLLVVRRARGEGNVGIADGRIVRLRSSSFGEETSGADFVGVHVVDASLALPNQGCIVGDVYIPALAAGRTIHAVYTDKPFVDVGTVAGYLAANRAWLRGRSSFIGPHAHAECALEDTVLGEGSRAEGEGTLVRCVVWPGAIARAPLSDAVITPTQVVKL